MRQIASSCLVAILAAGGLVPARAESGIASVEMDHWAVTAPSLASELRTGGVSTCIAVFLYDRRTKLGALGHFSAGVDSRAYSERMIGAMISAGANLRDVDAQLFGGWDTRGVKDITGFNSTSPEILAGIKAALRSQRIPIRREETLVVPFHEQSGQKSIRNLRMDLSTGQVGDWQ